MISGFIWKGFKPRVKYITVQLPKECGGLSLQHLQNYFKAAQLRFIGVIRHMRQNENI